MRRLRLKTPVGLVADYFRLFVNRRAYTLQSDRPHAERGRHYHFRLSDKRTGQGLSLTPDTLRGHIEGEITIALYAINPATQRCKWVAIGAGYQNALPDLIKLGYYLKQDGVESALEKSNSGGHLWIFMAEPPAGAGMPEETAGAPIRYLPNLRINPDFRFELYS